MYNSTIYDYYDDGGILGNRTLLFQTKEMVDRVGRGITPPPSHTTVHALAHGGFF